MRRTSGVSRLRALTAWIVLVLTLGCAGTQRPQTPTTDTTTVKPPEHLLTLADVNAEFDIRVPYTATLLVALHDLARVPGSFSAASTWKPWFGDWVTHPPTWLRNYRNAFIRLKRSPYYRHTLGHGYGAFYYCANTDRPIPELIDCLQRLYAPQDSLTIKTAVTHIDERLRVHWAQYQKPMGEFAEKMRLLLHQRPTPQLIQELRWFFDLNPSLKLGFTLVLVVIPPRDPSLIGGGRQHDTVLTLAVNVSSSVAQHAEIVFHELSHLASKHTLYRNAFIQGASTAGISGAITKSYAEEAMASAFGQGLAAARLNPNFDSRKAVFYYHPAIDAIARGLYEYWKVDRSLRFGSAFGAQLAHIVEQSYPQHRWTFEDYLRHFILMHTNDKVLPIIRNAQQMLRSAYTVFANSKKNTPKPGWHSAPH